MPKLILYSILFLNVSFIQAQMTYEGRLSPNESRAWLYGSLAVFAVLLYFVYNIEKISPHIKGLIRKFTEKNKS